MLIEILVIFLLFVTVWVVLGLWVRYVLKRGSLATGLRRGQPTGQRTLALPAGIHVAGQGVCCLEVPCSDACARELQAMRDRATTRYELVVAEMGKLINSGAGQEDAGRAG